MKNSGLFLNMAKWCFGGLFFWGFNIKRFVFGVSGIVSLSLLLLEKKTCFPPSFPPERAFFVHFFCVCLCFSLALFHFLLFLSLSLSLYIYICCGVIIWSKFGGFKCYYLVQVCFFIKHRLSKNTIKIGISALFLQNKIARQNFKCYYLVQVDAF